MDRDRPGGEAGGRRLRGRHTVAAALLVSAALTILIASWAATGWRSVRSQADALRVAPARAASAQAATLAAELAQRLDEVRRREDERPYFHYQNLFHDPRGAASGLAVVPSPLAGGPEDPLVVAHFQIDTAGVVTMPTVNEDVPELSAPGALADNRALLAELRGAIDALRVPAVARLDEAQQAPAPTPRDATTQPGDRPRRQNRAPHGRDGQAMAPRSAQQAAPPPQVQRIDPDVYAQNQMANAVYQQLKAPPRETPPKKTRPPAAAASARPEPARPAVRIATTGLRWRTARVGDTSRLLATRRVDTPDGTLTQGYLLDDRAIAGWLAERAAGMPARLVTADEAAPDSGASAELTGIGAMWRVQVDPGSAIAAAARRAAELERAFWWRVGWTSLIALACGALIVWIVARAELLARERSRFAAAAAHELRTPLAGLQLHGEMLADGLGDPARAPVYARRVADEAARLGRVVGNVLGFTQLERGNLSVSVTAADAAEAARRAVERMRPPLEHAGVRVACDADAAVPACFDEDAVARILQNLLDNAEKYTRGCPDRHVSVSAHALADGRAYITVTDNGPGIARRAERRLFAPFARAVAEDGPAGLGLGLALARALAEAQGGTLRHVRPVEGGARFELVLPAARRD